MSELNEGLNLLELYWSEESCLRVGDKVESIIVTMENGQMARVPWAIVKFANGDTCLVNLALCAEVLVEDTSKPLDNDCERGGDRSIRGSLDVM